MYTQEDIQELAHYKRTNKDECITRGHSRLYTLQEYRQECTHKGTDKNVYPTTRGQTKHTYYKITDRSIYTTKVQNTVHTREQTRMYTLQEDEQEHNMNYKKTDRYVYTTRQT